MFSWFGTVKDLLGSVHNLELLDKLHLPLRQLGEEPPEHEMGAWAKEQLDVLGALASYSLELAAGHVWNHAIYTICLPYAFACIHHESVPKRQEGLRRIRQVWDAVLRAEAWQRDRTLPASVQKALASLMQDLCWNLGQVAREIYSACNQHGWQASDQELREFSYLLFATPANTKHWLEDAFSHLADICARFARHQKLTKLLDNSTSAVLGV